MFENHFAPQNVKIRAIPFELYQLNTSTLYIAKNVINCAFLGKNE